MTGRSTLAQQFLDRSGWGKAKRRFLAGDASDRSYDRLRRQDETAVLMDAPPGKGDDPADFLRIARHLAGLGLSAPRILAEDLENGFLLIEDLGDTLYARIIPDNPSLETELYIAATDVLIHLQSHPPPPGLQDLSAQDWAKAACFAVDWYAFAVTGQRADSAGLAQVLGRAMTVHADGPRVMILRDYHAENLLWLPARKGVARAGLLDFQLAQMGQPAYDLVSLVQDARRDVPQAIADAMVAHFAAATEMQSPEAAVATLGAQRALRILGIFARLCLVAGKPHYTDLIPRVWGQLQRNLANPALADLAEICAKLLPEPTPEALQRIRAQCGQHPTS